MSARLTSCLSAGAAALALLAAPALATPDVTTVATDLGEVLADADGYVLYTFRKDSNGVSTCYDNCAANWPPFYAEESDTADGPYSIVKRDDGTLIWAKDGAPLYHWAKDTEPGMATGDGVGGNWDVARP